MEFKKLNRYVSILLAVILVFGVAMTGFAAEPAMEIVDDVAPVEEVAAVEEAAAPAAADEAPVADRQAGDMTVTVAGVSYPGSVSNMGNSASVQIYSGAAANGSDASAVGSATVTAAGIATIALTSTTGSNYYFAAVTADPTITSGNASATYDSADPTGTSVVTIGSTSVKAITLGQATGTTDDFSGTITLPVKSVSGAVTATYTDSNSGTLPSAGLAAYVYKAVSGQTAASWYLDPANSQTAVATGTVNSSGAIAITGASVLAADFASDYYVVTAPTTNAGRNFPAGISATFNFTATAPAVTAAANVTVASTAVPANVSFTVSGQITDNAIDVSGIATNPNLKVGLYVGAGTTTPVEVNGKPVTADVDATGRYMMPQLDNMAPGPYTVAIVQSVAGAGAGARLYPATSNGITVQAGTGTTTNAQPVTGNIGLTSTKAQTTITATINGTTNSVSANANTYDVVLKYKNTIVQTKPGPALSSSNDTVVFDVVDHVGDEKNYSVGIVGKSALDAVDDEIVTFTAPLALTGAATLVVATAPNVLTIKVVNGVTGAVVPNYQIVASSITGGTVTPDSRITDSNGLVTFKNSTVSSGSVTGAAQLVGGVRYVRTSASVTSIPLSGSDKGTKELVVYPEPSITDVNMKSVANASVVTGDTGSVVGTLFNATTTLKPSYGTQATAGTALNTFTYQWQYREDASSLWKNVETASAAGNATSATLAPDANLLMGADIWKNGYQFRCLVTPQDNVTTELSKPVAMESSVATLTVADGYTISGTVSNNSIAMPGVRVKVYSGYGTQAQKEVDDVGTYTSSDAGKVPGTYTTKKLPAGITYTLVVSDFAYSGVNYRGGKTEAPLGGADYIDAKIIVAAKPAVEITEQPRNVMGDETKSATFTVKTVNNLGSGAIAYQWRVDKNDGKGPQDIIGAVTSTLTVSSLTTEMNGYVYDVKVSLSTTQVVSDPAILRVNAFAAPQFTVQPANVDAAAGRKVEIPVTVSGAAPITYKWFIDRNDGNGFVATSGAAFSTDAATGKLTINQGYTTSSWNGYKFQLVATNMKGTEQSTATSDAAVLSIVSPTLITIADSPKNTVGAIGKPAEFSVTVEGTGPYYYQWQYSLDGGNTWVDTTISDQTYDTTHKFNTPQTMIPAYANKYQVRVKVQNMDKSTTITSNAATVTSIVDPTPVSIATHPASQSVVNGRSVTFTAEAQGTKPYYYQWEKLDPDGANWEVITGKSFSNADGANELKIDYVSYSMDKTQYRVLVASNNNPDEDEIGYSNSAVLTVIDFAPLTITSQPADTQAAVGSEATFSVTAGGSGPFTYQWFKNGTAISGAADATLNYTVEAEDEGAKFSVVVKNVEGDSLTSNEATLTTGEAVLVDSIIVTGPTIMEAATAKEITVAVGPTDATNKAVTWSTSDEAIATVAVNDEGKIIVTAVADGSVDIIATAKDASGVEGRLTITVGGQAADSITVESSVDPTGEKGVVLYNGGPDEAEGGALVAADDFDRETILSVGTPEGTVAPALVEWSLEKEDQNDVVKLTNLGNNRVKVETVGRGVALVVASIKEVNAEGEEIVTMMNTQRVAVKQLVNGFKVTGDGSTTKSVKAGSTIKAWFDYIPSRTSDQRSGVSDRGVTRQITDTSIAKLVKNKKGDWVIKGLKAGTTDFVVTAKDGSGATETLTLTVTK